MKINATLSISHRQDCISIRLQDEDSRAEFVDAEISHAEFARALGALQSRPLLQCEVRGLDTLGKKRVWEKRSIECPLDSYDKAVLSAWLEANAQEDGWILNTHLGSQDSISHKVGKTILRYSVTKYVDLPVA